MPIRRAAVATQPAKSESVGWVFSLVVIGVFVGLALAFGDHASSTSRSYPPVVIEPIRPELFEPVLLDPRFANPMARIPLDYDLHVSQLANGQLFATGLLTANEPVEAITLAAYGYDPAGEPVATQYAVVSCKSLQAGERCAWMIEGEMAQPVARIELEPTARKALGLEPPQLDLRSDRPGEIDFDPDERTVQFVTRDRTVAEAWATVTAYSPEGGVLGVAETRYPGYHPPGRHRFTVALPKPPDEVGSYEVRVGGRLEEWAPAPQ